jgi:hypothetical protein
VADVLVKIERPLSLNDLTELSPETAAPRSQRPPVPKLGAMEARTGSPDIRLNGVKCPSAPAAEALAGVRTFEATGIEDGAIKKWNP